MPYSNGAAHQEDRPKPKRVRRERATLDLNESEIYWSLVGELEEIDRPLALLWYIIKAEYLGDECWRVPSKSDPSVFYETDLSRHWCSCPRASHVNACGHLKAMLIRSRIQFAKAGQP